MATANVMNESSSRSDVPDQMTQVYNAVRDLNRRFAQETPKRPSARRVRQVQPSEPERLGLLTIDDLAKALGKAPKTIRNWVARRQIPFVFIGNRTYFRSESIDAWLSKQEFRA